MIFACSPETRFAPWRTSGWLVATATAALAGLTGWQVGSSMLAVAGAAGAIAAGMGLWIVRTIRYEIADLDLVAHYGPFRRRVPLECIEGVTRASRSAVGFPRRLVYLTLVHRERGRDRMLHLYPDDAHGLLDALAAGAPFLERRGDGIVRVPALVASP